jgi:hypothetical protein
MQRSKALKIGIPVFLILLLSISIFAFATPQIEEIPDWDFPRLDELWMIEAYPRTVSMEKARACDIDNFIGAIVVDDVDELVGLGWSASMNPGFHMCYAGPNCRDYTPDSSGVWWDNGGRLPGDPLYPMNISQFRMALELVVGCEKDAWIAEIYGFINVRLDTDIPPASSYWYNPYIAPYAEDWAKARNVLLGAGFTHDMGADATPHTGDDIWYMPNGVKLIGGPDSTSPGSDRVGGYTSDTHEPDKWGIQFIGVGRSLAPTSYEIGCRHVEKWNEFFTGVVLDCEVVSRPDHSGFDPDHCSDGALFHFLEDNTFDPLILVPFYNRDHDFYFLCWGLGRNPDYLYDFFHPDADVEGGDNSPGLDHPGLNRLLWAIKMWALKDVEFLEINNGEYPAGLVIPACKYYTLPYPTPPIHGVQIERCSQELGVYDEELVAGVDYNVVGIELHIKEDITLYPGDALEIKFETCTYTRAITDVDEMRELVWLAQWKLYYLVPYLPIYSRNYINLFKPGLVSWVESSGYGSCPTDSQLPWTFASIHWAGAPVGGSMKWHIAGDCTTLNPFTVAWVYEAMIFNRMYDALYAINPYTHADIPWVAQKWQMIPWDEAPSGNGMILKIWIRNDVYWQDGNHVTAEDIKWNFDFINSTQAPEYTPIISPYYQGAEVVHDYCIEIFIDASGLWKAYEFMGAALTFPRIVWEPFWGDYTGAREWDPWNVDYATWTGETPAIAGLTCLFGTGPWVLDYWNEIDTAHLVRNPNYWVRVATKLQQCDQLVSIYFPGQCAKVVDDTIIPKLNRPILKMQVTNVDTKEPCEFSYTLYMDGEPIIDEAGITILDPCETVEIDLALPSPTAIAPCVHEFVIEVHTVELGDNIYTYTAAITFGDMNCDSKVDIKDLVLLIKAYGSIPGHPRWNENGDLNGDGKIDIKDLVLIIRYYGKFCAC